MAARRAARALSRRIITTPVARSSDADADADEHEHEHDDHDDDAPHAHHHLRNDTSQARLAAALEHGRHSLAHHDLAVQPPALVVVWPLPIDRRPVIVDAVAAIDPVSIRSIPAVARGPPA